MEDTKYKVETTDKREMELMLNATRMSLVLYDIMNWKRAIYNGKNYGEGSIIYKGKLYSKDEWHKIEHDESEYDENHYLKEKAYYVYTEDELIRKLDNIMDDIHDFIYHYYE